VHLANQPDTGCGGTEIWARSTMDRRFTVVAAQDGTGYYVTRYDTNGTFTTIPGTGHPGDCANLFDSADTGTFSGVWTRKVMITGVADYNPDAAMPADASWPSFLAAFFNVTATAVDPPTTSYEFDYYNACGDHWRDASYAGGTFTPGSIGNCPR
jgi:hypothetical protein